MYCPVQCTIQECSVGVLSCIVYSTGVQCTRLYWNLYRRTGQLVPLVQRGQKGDIAALLPRGLENGLTSEMQRRKCEAQLSTHYCNALLSLYCMSA